MKGVIKMQELAVSTLVNMMHAWGHTVFLILEVMVHGCIVGKDRYHA